MKQFSYFCVLILSLTIFISLTTSTSFAGLRCPTGTDILEVGDGKLKVIGCFGEPEYKEERIVRKRSQDYRTEVETVVESWYYVIDHWNYRIVIANGRVTGIQDLGRE